MSLCEWYSGREVLLTGVTSELGRALLEKLLRSCPNVKVYAVLRSRHGNAKDDRIRKIFGSPGYERLRQEQPNAISRVTAFEGNLLCDDLGLSKEDVAALKRVSVVLHAAGPHDAVLEFCRDLPELRAVSAASNIFKHRGQISESLQNEHVPKVPLALVRIPVVGPALREPMPGFVEVMKGPTALMVGAGFALGHSDLPAEMLPVDLAANTMIATAWERGRRNKTAAPIVYNVPSLGCTWGQLIEKGQRASKIFAYPTFGIRGMTAQPWLHRLVVLLFEWLPSMLCDTTLSLIGAKPRFLEEHVRVRNALQSLEPVLTRSWPSEKNHVHQLHDSLIPEEQETFCILADIDIETYILCSAGAIKKYCLDEASLNIVKGFKLGFLLLVVTVLVYVLFIR